MAEAVRRSKKEALEQAKEDLVKHIHETRCHPILIRLGWHDAGTYNKVRAATSSLHQLEVVHFDDSYGLILVGKHVN